MGVSRALMEWADGTDGGCPRAVDPMETSVWPHYKEVYDFRIQLLVYRTATGRNNELDPFGTWEANVIIKKVTIQTWISLIRRSLFSWEIGSNSDKIQVFFWI